MPPRHAFLPAPPLFSPRSTLPLRSSRRAAPRAAAPSYDDFDKLLGGGGKSSGGDGTRQPSKKPDPRDYSRFDTLLERTGGEGRKIKSQKRYLARPSSGPGAGSSGVGGSGETGDAPAGGGGSGETGDTPAGGDPSRGASFLPKGDTSRMGADDVERGYEAMDAFLDAGDGDGASVAASEVPQLQKPTQFAKPGYPGGPGRSRENWDGVPDPTRKTVASLDGLPKAGGGLKPTLVRKPAGRDVEDADDLSEEAGSSSAAREFVPKADTSPLGSEEIASGYEAMDAFIKGDELAGAPELTKPGSGRLRRDWEGVPDPTRKQVASLDNLPKVSGASKPTLVQKPAARGASEEEVEREAPVVPGLVQPILRRVTDDPDTWRRDWEGVPDPTRKVVASLDAEPDALGGPPPPALVEKPTGAVVPEGEEAAISAAPPAAAAAPELLNPGARRVTDDPETWRKDWEGVPDPTRKPVADLDRPFPKLGKVAPLSASEKPVAINKPSAPTPEVLAAASPAESQVPSPPILELQNPRVARQDSSDLPIDKSLQDGRLPGETGTKPKGG